MAKIRVKFKDPDATHYPVIAAVEQWASTVVGLSEDQLSDAKESQTDTYQRAFSQWMEYGEYLDVEFDTEAGAATVLPKGSIG